VTDTNRNSIQTMLEQSRATLSTLPQSERWQAEIQSLHTRLVAKQKLVAVFGAFSAGKSSLLNALLGDAVLAVSPNPTTAAVTHVQADIDAGGAAARVYAKTHDEMWDDVRQSFAGIHREAVDLEDAMRQAKTLKMADFSPLARKSVSFLLAAAAGYAQMLPRLGTNWPISQAEVRQYTAEESFACYLTRVDLASRSAQLGDGFVLVDTPGVDSIHRRHTDVAFEYMRKADAVVFVLYYTHAFSRADKDFLSQLSGVQDVVGTDKLFVVINAVDLATSAEEQADVRNRVIAELRQAGIRAPRVYEVSSQLAYAAERLERDASDATFTQLARLRLRLAAEDALPSIEHIRALSGMAAFREALQRFVDDKSEVFAQETTLRTLRDVAHKVEARLARLEASFHQDAQSRAQAHAAQQALAQALRAFADEVSRGAWAEEQALLADWKELTFHSGERLRLKFSSLFREAFHPGRFRDTAKVKTQLQDAARELQQSLVRQVEIEIRTFSLRMEAKMGEAKERLSRQLAERCAAVGAGGIDIAYDAFAGEAGLASLATRAEVSSSPIVAGFNHFSSAKQFFEGGGQTAMLRAVESAVLDEIRRVLNGLADARITQGVVWLRDAVATMSNALAKRIEQLALDVEANQDALELRSTTAAASAQLNALVAGLQTAHSHT